MNDVESILVHHGLRRTSFRKELLKMFYDVRSSLTAEEICSRVGASYDKATVYRSLLIFEKKGLIHQVPDRNNLVRYALCKGEDCRPKDQIHSHAHFICEICHETFCLDEIEPPNIELVKGFKVRISKLTLEGECPDCAKKSQRSASEK